MSQTTSTIKANFNNVYVYINVLKRKQQQSFWKPTELLQETKMNYPSCYLIKWTYMRDVEQSPDRSWTMDRRPNFLQSLLVTHASTPNLKITDLIQFRNLSILNLCLKLHILLQVFLLVMVFCACNILLKSVLEGLCHFYLKGAFNGISGKIFI